MSETKNDNYKIALDESEIAEIRDDKPNNNKHTETNIKLTNKRVYITTKNKEEESKCIVELGEIDTVTYIDEKIRKYGFVWAILGVIALIVGAVFVAISFKKTGIYLKVGAIIAACGFLIFIIGLIVARRHHFFKLIIGSTSSQIEVYVGEIKPESIEKMQKLIFQTKDDMKINSFLS